MKFKILVFLGALALSSSVQASNCLQEGYAESIAAHNATQQIIDAFKTKNTKPIADLMYSYISYGPSQKYVRNNDFDDIFSDESRKMILALEGTDDQCRRIGTRGFLMGNGAIWIGWAGAESNVNIASIMSLDIAKEIKTSTIAATNDYWESDAGNLHPNCFAYEDWYSPSVGIYGAVAEQYEIDGFDEYRNETDEITEFEIFLESPGQFFGSKITDFNMFETRQDDSHIGFKTSECIANQPETKVDEYNGIVEEICDSNGWCDSYSYKLLEVVPRELCNSLAENFNGKCKSSYLVRINNEPGGTLENRRWGIYGLFDSTEHGEVIFPLKLFDTGHQANEFLQ